MLTLSSIVRCAYVFVGAGCMYIYGIRRSNINVMFFSTVFCLMI